MKCHAQASLYMRTANAARSLLLRIQTARRKREAIQANCDHDASVEHCAAGLMAAAKGTPTPELPPPPPVLEPAPAAIPQTTDEKYAQYDEAEQYALMYPRRAAEIRAHGGVPDTARWGCPADLLVLQIISSPSPILQQIDEEYAATLRRDQCVPAAVRAVATSDFSPQRHRDTETPRRKHECAPREAH